MFKTVFRLTVCVGPYEFHREFSNEAAALACFDHLAVNAEDVAIEGDKCTLDSNASVESVTIHRTTVPIRIGDPNR